MSRLSKVCAKDIALGECRKGKSEGQGLSLTLNKDSGFPIYLQIAHQILHHVESGALQTGSLLPSIRKQAGLLQISPLTVDDAYRWLSARGIIAAERGVGFRILVDLDGSLEQKQRRGALADLVEQTLAQCQREGFDSVMFAQAIMARAGVGNRRTVKREILFIECQPEYVSEYTTDLSAELADTALSVSGLLVSSLPRKVSADTPEGKRLIEADYVATTLYHYELVNKLLAPLKRTVLTLSHTLDKAALRRIAALSPRSRIGAILGPVDPATTIVHTIEQYHRLTTGPIPYASINDEAAALKVIRQSDIIAYTAPCEPLIRRLKVARSKSILIRFVPDEEAVRKVKALLSSKSITPVS